MPRARSLEHPSIVRLETAFFDPPSRLHLVFEWVEGGALDVRLERANATSYTIEVANEFDVTTTLTVTCGGA